MHRSHARVATPMWPWIVFVTIASLLLSRAFACATPFPALASLAAMMPKRREAVALLLATWLGNQAVGFGLLHYPWTASTLGWGLAIGAATFAAWGASQAAALVPAPVAGLRMAAMLVASVAACEATLLLATLVLPSGPGAFAAAVVLRIIGINAAALFLLLTARRLAAVAGVVPQNQPVSHRA